MICKLCGHDNATHIITLKTGRPVSERPLEGWTYTWQKYEITYDDVLLHTFNVCHHCWTAQWRLVLSIVVIGTLGLIATFLFIDDGILGFTALAATFILIVILGYVFKPRTVWTRLQRIALQERGGPPFQVFLASKDGTELIPPSLP
jgi:hypothetical protein